MGRVQSCLNRVKSWVRSLVPVCTNTFTYRTHTPCAQKSRREWAGGRRINAFADTKSSNNQRGEEQKRRRTRQVPIRSQTNFRWAKVSRPAVSDLIGQRNSYIFINSTMPPQRSAKDNNRKREECEEEEQFPFSFPGRTTNLVDDACLRDVPPKFTESFLRHFATSNGPPQVLLICLTLALAAGCTVGVVSILWTSIGRISWIVVC